MKPMRRTRKTMGQEASIERDHFEKVWKVVVGQFYKSRVIEMPVFMSGILLKKLKK